MSCDTGGDPRALGFTVHFPEGMEMCGSFGGTVHWKLVKSIFSVQSLSSLLLWENIFGFIKPQWLSIHSVPSCHKHLFRFMFFDIFQ